MRCFSIITILLAALVPVELAAQVRNLSPLSHDGQSNNQRGYRNPTNRQTGAQNQIQHPGARGERQSEAGDGREETPFFGEGSENRDDTVKKKRARKALESYFFDNDTRARLNFAWMVDPFTNNISQGRIDSVQPDFHNYYPFMKLDVGSAHAGPLGGPTQWLNFFDRPRGRDHSFSEPWAAYLRTVENMPFYNTKRAFSQLGYQWMGRKDIQEEDLVVIHAQNISPQTGFNIDYRSQGTKGIYSWQGARNKTFSAGVNHTGKRWTVHAGYIHNQVLNQENGGMVDDDDIIVRDNTYEGLMRNVPMKMNGPRNIVRGNTFFLVQSMGFPLMRVREGDFTIADRPAFFVGHSIEYDRWKRRYEDTYDGTVYKDPLGATANSIYYEKWWMNGTMSRDSLFEGRLSNRVFVQLQPWDRGGVIGTIDAGVGVDALKYYMFSADQYLTGVANAAVKETHYYIYGRAEGHLSRFFDWRAHMKVHPMGGRGGDTEAGGEVAARLFYKGRPLSLSGRVRFTTQEPSYWERNFTSNHFMWSNSFDKESETRFEGSLEIPHVGFAATVSQSVLGGKIYFDERALPAQAADAVSVTGVYLREDLPIRIGSSAVNLNHRVMLQWSTDQKVVSVPLASVYASYSFEFNVVKNVLRLQLGLDGRYNTKYYGPGYNPGVGRLYNQREKQLGDYVWADAFVNAKWKRMRIIVKWQHVNDNLFGTRNFFSVLHYPMNRRMVKLGLSWNFYD